MSFSKQQFANVPNKFTVFLDLKVLKKAEI